MTPVLLFDGDLIAYRAACGKDEEGEGVTLERAIQNMEDHISWVSNRLGSNDHLMYLSGNQNFRKELYPAYKENRSGSGKPPLLLDLKLYLELEYGAETVDCLEADDLMGMQASYSGNTRPHIMVSIDKDMKQIPGLLFNPSHPEDGVVEISKQSADRMFYMQILQGDSTDNYPGCPGIGPKKAEKLLDSLHPEENPWPYIVAEYKHHLLDESFALVQARLARILRSGEFDPVEGRPILWEP